MDNILLSSQALPSDAHGNVAQTGDNNFYLANYPGGNVTVNLYLPQPDSSDNAEQMIAIQSFSKEYYQLLVSTEEDLLTSNVITIPKARALGQRYVPPEIFDRCSSLTDAGIEELKTFPAIICQENTGYGGVTDPKQMAIYGYLKKVRIDECNIKIAFHTIGVFRQQILCQKKSAIYFDLTLDCALTDLNHSAWSVHKVNLFEAFDEVGITGIPKSN